MLKNILIVASMLFILTGCGGGGSDSTAVDTNETEVVIPDQLDFNNSTVIVPNVIIPYTGGDFDITFIPTKDDSLVLQENAIQITKSIGGYVVDSSWADILYDVVHKVYIVEGTIHYNYNGDDNNISSIIKAVYYTNGETKIFQTVEVTQLGNLVVEPIVSFDTENFEVVRDEQGNIAITEKEVGDFTIDPITEDDIVNIAEAAGNINVTGTSVDGSTITFQVNGHAYVGGLTNGTWSIPVLGSDLVADTDFTATITGEDSVGNVISLTATSIHTVDTQVDATLTMNLVTSDNNVTIAESGGAINLSGTVTGELEEGDTISILSNGTTYTTSVVANGTWNIDVSGTNLHTDTTTDIHAGGTDEAGNPISITLVHTHTVE